MKTNQLPLTVTRLLVNIFVACLFGFFAGEAYSASANTVIIDVNEAITGVNHSISGDIIVSELISSSTVASNQFATIPEKYTCDVLKESRMNIVGILEKAIYLSTKNRRTHAKNVTATESPPKECMARSDLLNTS